MNNDITEQHAKIENGTSKAELDQRRMYGSRPKLDALDQEWKDVVRIVDHICFFVFIFIFSMLFIIMVYPYDTSVQLES